MYGNRGGGRGDCEFDKTSSYVGGNLRKFNVGVALISKEYNVWVRVCFLPKAGMNYVLL